MSATYNEAVKRILSDVNKFLSVSLKSENLSKIVDKERSRLLEQLQDLFCKYDSLAPTTSDEGSSSSVKEIDESRNTTGSSHGSEDDGYSENVPDTTVKALSPDADIFGYLDKKGKDILFGIGSGGWKKMYCVLHKNIFYFFKKPGDKKQQGAFSIAGYSVQEAPQNVRDASKKDCSFELVCSGKKSYQFCADSNKSFEEWKSAINKSQQGMVQEEEALEDADDVYEPLDEVTTQAAKTIAKPAEPPIGTPTVAATEDKQGSDGVINEDWDDDLIYEPVEGGNETTPPPAPTIPLPPLPTSADSALPPLPSRDPGGDKSDKASGESVPALPPALPKRNPLPIPPNAVPEKKRRIPVLGDFTHPSEDFENMFYGLYSCKGSSDNELSFEPGDIIHVINRDLDSEDWWIGELSKKIGLVPRSFLHPAYQCVEA